MVLKALKTTTTGWLPKPVALRRARWQHSEEEIGDDELREAQQSATRDALQWQERLGLDLLTDGQMDRSDPATFFAERLEGMRLAGLVRCLGNRFYRKPVIVGPVLRREALTVEHWKAAAAIAGKPVKAILTGPYTLMDWSFDEHYGSRETCCMALAEVVREEARDLLQAGVREIQLDEQAISARPAEMALARRALAHVTEPLEGRVRTWAHLCYGDWLPVIDEILNLPVDGLLLGLSHADDELLERLGALPAPKVLGAGVIDVHAKRVESQATLRARVERLLRHVPAERLWLTPDSGLRALSLDLAGAKLEAMVAAASGQT